MRVEPPPNGRFIYLMLVAEGHSWEIHKHNTNKIRGIHSIFDLAADGVTSCQNRKRARKRDIYLGTFYWCTKHVIRETGTVGTTQWGGELIVNNSLVVSLLNSSITLNPWGKPSVNTNNGRRSKRMVWNYFRRQNFRYVQIHIHLQIHIHIHMHIEVYVEFNN